LVVGVINQTINTSELEFLSKIRFLGFLQGKIVGLVSVLPVNCWTSLHEFWMLCYYWGHANTQTCEVGVS